LALRFRGLDAVAPRISREATMRVPDAALRSIVYLGYQTPGGTFVAKGTGFLVDLNRTPGGAIYLITAHHVASKLNQPFAIRFNDRAGQSHVQLSQQPQHKWWYHPTDSSVDAAVFPWGLRGRTATFPVSRFITEVNLDLIGIGIGDEVFIVGLFREWAGRAQVTPIVRHGHIAMMANELIPTRNYSDALLHLVEALSLGGLSGSPVIVRQTVGVSALRRSRTTFDPEIGMALGDMYLLGLVHGYYPTNAEGATSGATKWHTGISMVVPSTKILEILNQPKLVEFEKRIVEAMKKRDDDKPVETAMEESKPKPSRKSRDKDVSEHPNKGRFFNDLAKAIQKREKK